MKSFRLLFILVPFFTLHSTRCPKMSLCHYFFRTSTINNTKKLAMKSMRNCHPHETWLHEIRIHTISAFIRFKFSGAPTQLSSFGLVLCAHESIFLSCFPVHIITLSFFSSLPVFFLSFPPCSSSFSSLKLLWFSYANSLLLTTTIRMPGRPAKKY